MELTRIKQNKADSQNCRLSENFCPPGQSPAVGAVAKTSLLVSRVRRAVWAGIFGAGDVVAAGVGRVACGI